MIHTKLGAWLLPIFLFIGCSAEDTSDAFPKKIDAAAFTLHTPQDWHLYEDSGIDTYTGRIAGPDDTIYFDQGYLSFGGLENISEDDHTLYFQRLKVSNIPSILHKEQFVEGSDGEIRLSIYIDAGDKKRLNRLYVLDPANEEQIIKICMSHKFK